MVTVVDDIGKLLAEASTDRAEDSATVSLSRVSATGRLLGYYFGGGRTVQVYSGMFRLNGRLGTRWENGRRVWWVRLDVPAQSREDA